MHTHRAEKNNQAFQEESAAEVVLVKSVWENKNRISHETSFQVCGKEHKPWKMEEEKYMSLSKAFITVNENCNHLPLHHQSFTHKRVSHPGTVLWKKMAPNNSFFSLPVGCTNWAHTDVNNSVNNLHVLLGVNLKSESFFIFVNRFSEPVWADEWVQNQCSWTGFLVSLSPRSSSPAVAAPFWNFWSAPPPPRPRPQRYNNTERGLSKCCFPGRSGRPSP